MMVMKTYNIQLLENLMYLGLHPPKRGKLHPCENFEHLSSSHWPMNESFPYGQSQQNVNK
jgi:hypothetical protein